MNKDELKDFYALSRSLALQLSDTICDFAEQNPVESKSRKFVGTLSLAISNVMASYLFRCKDIHDQKDAENLFEICNRQMIDSYMLLLEQKAKADIIPFKKKSAKQEDFS